MKSILTALIAVTVLTGCVGFVPVPVGGGAGYHPRYDRDGDGVSNRYDRRPNNPYRY
jgi:hypothetical protein